MISTSIPTLSVPLTVPVSPSHLYVPLPLLTHWVLPSGMLTDLGQVIVAHRSWVPTVIPWTGDSISELPSLSSSSYLCLPPLHPTQLEMFIDLWKWGSSNRLILSWTLHSFLLIFTKCCLLQRETSLTGATHILGININVSKAVWQHTPCLTCCLLSSASLWNLYTNFSDYCIHQACKINTHGFLLAQSKLLFLLNSTNPFNMYSHRVHEDLPCPQLHKSLHSFPHQTECCNICPS